MKLRTSLGVVDVTHERVVTKTPPNVVRMFRFTLGTQIAMLATWKDTPPFTEDGVRELIRDAGGAAGNKPTSRLADALREVAGLAPVISDDDAGDSNEYVRGDIIPDTTGGGAAVTEPMRLALLWEREPRTRPQDETPPATDVCSMAILRFLALRAQPILFPDAVAITRGCVQKFAVSEHGSLLGCLIAAANAALDETEGERA